MCGFEQDDTSTFPLQPISNPLPLFINLNLAFFMCENPNNHQLASRYYHGQPTFIKNASSSNVIDELNEFICSICCWQYNIKFQVWFDIITFSKNFGTMTLYASQQNTPGKNPSTLLPRCTSFLKPRKEGNVLARYTTLSPNRKCQKKRGKLLPRSQTR